MSLTILNTILFTRLVSFQYLTSYNNYNVDSPPTCDPYYRNCDCSDGYSCFDEENITIHDEFRSLNCYGDHSCSMSTIYYDNTQDIGCHGAFSCFGSSFNIIRDDSSNSAIECNGLYSCAFISNFNSGTHYVECFGEKACYGSSIYMVEDDSFTTLTCKGDKSCTDIYLSGTDDINIYAYGHLALMNSIIQTDSSGIVVKIILEGLSSGYNATFICNSGDTCIFRCHSNACNNFNNICHHGSSCTDECDYYGNLASEKNDMCPNGFELLDDVIPDDLKNDANNNWPWLNNIEFSTLENSNTFCNYNSMYVNNTNENNILVIDDFNGWKSNNYSNSIYTNDHNQYYGSICCTAYNGCNNINEFGTRTNNSISIRCDGEQSCNNNNVIYTYVEERNIYSGGNIYYSGYKSGSSTQIVVGNNDNTNIICSGYYSCSEIKYISNALNLYCLGEYSCAEIGIVQNITNNIWAVASYAFYEVGNQYVTNILNIGGNVYCLTRLSCAYLTMKNIGGYVFASSYDALTESEIINAKEVFCNGYGSCEQVKISNTQNIAFGENSMAGSRVYSKLTLSDESNNNTMIVAIFGNNNNYLDTTHSIYCNNSDTCIVYCDDSYSCINTLLYCHSGSDCIVCCNNVECPSGDDTNWHYRSCLDSSDEDSSDDDDNNDDNDDNNNQSSGNILLIGNYLIWLMYFQLTLFTL